MRINEFAFGRDNQGVFPDRCLTRYTLQFTTVANPDAATADTSWTTIGTLDYFSAGGANFAAPGLRHRYSFTPVMATGLRLITLEAGTGIDEIEIYPQVGIVLNGGGLTLVSEGGTFAPENLRPQRYRHALRRWCHRGLPCSQHRASHRRPIWQRLQLGE
ncbi:MAG: hypothetical protein IPK97_14505 [Ahniella sp.]|nr:hypothetical protein [Ahniella sp.]